MAITVRELGQSRTISETMDMTAEAQLRYIVLDDSPFDVDTDIDDIEAAVLAKAPVVYRNCRQDRLNISPYGDNGKSWTAEVDYNRNKLEPGTFSLSFNTAGGSITAYQSLAWTTYPPTEEGEYHGAIQQQPDGTVDGVEIVVPTLQVQCRAGIKQGFVTSGYLDTLSAMTGTVSATPFLGWAAQEVLLLGVQGDWEVGKDLTLTFDLAISKNKTGLTIGSLSGIAKAGHDYLWIKYQKLPNTVGKGITSKPERVFVNRVYEQTDFSALCIGV